MGLLYIMPASKEEFDHVKIEENEKSGHRLTLKSYGLPLMFWGYFLIVLALEFAMYISISSIIAKLYQSENQFDFLIALLCALTMVAIPLFGLILLFFQKVIIKENDKLIIQFKVFGLIIRTKSFRFETGTDHLEVTHLLESPNMAKIQKNPNTRAFENQGHYVLTLWSENKPHYIDRHTRKSDLKKLADLITGLN